MSESRRKFRRARNLKHERVSWESVDNLPDLLLAARRGMHSWPRLVGQNEDGRTTIRTTAAAAAAAAATATAATAAAAAAAGGRARRPLALRLAGRTPRSRAILPGRGGPVSGQRCHPPMAGDGPGVCRTAGLRCGLVDVPWAIHAARGDRPVLAAHFADVRGAGGGSGPAASTLVERGVGTAAATAPTPACGGGRAGGRGETEGHTHARRARRDHAGLAARRRGRRRVFAARRLIRVGRLEGGAGMAARVRRGIHAPRLNLQGRARPRGAEPLLPLLC